MSKMSEMHQDLEAIKRIMENDMGDDVPMTPKELAEVKVDHAVRDCWLASAELVKLKAQDVHAAPFILRAEGDLWSIKLRIDLLLSEIRATEPQLKVVSNG